jgi:hypothetical protein
MVRNRLAIMKREDAAGRCRNAQRTDNRPQRRGIEEDDGALEAERVCEYARTAHQSRVGARQQVEHCPKARDLRQRGGKPFMAMPYEHEYCCAQGQREEEERHGGHNHERVRLPAPGHDREGRCERRDVGQVVRDDVEDRRLHRWRWHLAPLERLRDQDAAANTGRGERLIGKQLARPSSNAVVRES